MSSCSLKLFVGVATLIFSCPSFAREPECKRVHDIYRRYWNNSEDPSLKGHVPEWKTQKSGESFDGWDIDKDGKADTIKRRCGKFLPLPCDLKVNFTSGGELALNNIPYFDIIKSDGAIYIFERKNTITSPNSRTFELIMSQLEYQAISEVCRWETIVN